MLAVNNISVGSHPLVVPTMNLPLCLSLATCIAVSTLILSLLRVFFKFLSSRSFVKSRWLWVHLLDIFRLCLDL